MKISISNAALIAASLVAGTAFAQGATKSPSAAPPPVKPATAAAPAGDADEALVEKQCSSCHGMDQVTARSRTAAEWAETIDRMIGYGAQLSAEDNKKITDFLAAHYGAKDGSKQN